MPIFLYVKWFLNTFLSDLTETTCLLFHATAIICMFWLQFLNTRWRWSLQFVLIDSTRCDVYTCTHRSDSCSEVCPYVWVCIFPFSLVCCQSRSWPEIRGGECYVSHLCLFVYSLNSVWLEHLLILDPSSGVHLRFIMSHTHAVLYWRLLLYNAFLFYSPEV